MKSEEPKPLSQIAIETRYPVGAFLFVRRGLDFTVHRIHEHPEQLPEGERHVSGRQLSAGLRDFAIDQYGRLARTVLRRWRINQTADFGRLVFAMVEGGLMQATENDSVHDFDNCFDFEAAFKVDIPVEQIPLDDPQLNVLGDSLNA
jgi:uncharacterized repeat protein (TIGR04138 family)